MKRKVIWSIATILISIPLLMDAPFAEGNNVHTWAYGTYSSDFNSALDNLQVDGVLNIPFGSSTVPIPVAKTRAYQEINFQMTNYMDGYVSMYFNNMPSVNLCDLYVSNATIQSWNWQTGYLSLAINGVDNFTVTLVNRSTFTSWLTSEVTITWSGITLNAVNAPAYSLHNVDLKLADCNSTLSSILSAVDNLESYTDNIETLIGDTNSYLSAISTNIGTQNTTLNTINNKLNDISSILTTVNSIAGYVDGLETLTGDINDNITGLRTQLQVLNQINQRIDYSNTYLSNIQTRALNIMNDVDEINTELTNQGLTLDDILTQFQTQVTVSQNILIQAGSMNNQLTNLKNYVQTMVTGINNLLLSDNLPIYSGPFVDILDVNNAIWNNDIQGTYTIINGNSYTYDVYLLTGFKYIWLYACNRDVSTLRPVFASSNVTSSVTRTLRSHNLTYYMVETTVTSSNRYTFTWNATTDFNIYPLYFGTDWSIPSELMFITRNAFNDMYTSKLQDVINAINNMSVNVNNMTVNATGITYNTNQTDVYNSVTNYNTNINKVFNVENNLSLDFDTYNQQFNPDFTDTLQSIQVAPQVMNNIMTSLYDLPFIKYPTLITLAGIVFLALLGV